MVLYTVCDDRALVNLTIFSFTALVMASLPSCSLSHLSHLLIRRRIEMRMREGLLDAILDPTIWHGICYIHRVSHTCAASDDADNVTTGISDN